MDFLSALTDDELASFRAVGRSRRFSRGQALFHEGDDPGGVIAIVSGRVKVSVMGAGQREVVLRFPAAGELIGELSAMAGRPRTATVTAVNEVETIAVRPIEFQRYMAEHPRVSRLVFERLVDLVADADRQLADLATRDVTSRVAGRLIELAEAKGVPASGALALSQEELAAWTGSSREAVARSLQLLRRLGWVETRRRQIRVLSLEGLRSLT